MKFLLDRLRPGVDLNDRPGLILLKLLVNLALNRKRKSRGQQHLEYASSGAVSGISVLQLPHRKGLRGVAVFQTEPNLEVEEGILFRIYSEFGRYDRVRGCRYHAVIHSLPK